MKISRINEMSVIMAKGDPFIMIIACNNKCQNVT